MGFNEVRALEKIADALERIASIMELNAVPCPVIPRDDSKPEPASLAEAVSKAVW